MERKYRALYVHESSGDSAMIMTRWAGSDRRRILLTMPMGTAVTTVPTAPITAAAPVLVDPGRSVGVVVDGAASRSATAGSSVSVDTWRRCR